MGLNIAWADESGPILDISRMLILSRAPRDSCDVMKECECLFGFRMSGHNMLIILQCT